MYRYSDCVTEQLAIMDFGCCRLVGKTVVIEDPSIAAIFPSETQGPAIRMTPSLIKRLLPRAYLVYAELIGKLA